VSEDLYRVTSYREFTDHTKAAVTELVRGYHSQRPPTPMVHMVVEGGNIDLIAVEDAFFDPEHPERRAELIERFIVPLVRERGVSMVGWSFAARHTRHSVALDHAGVPRAAGNEEVDVLAVVVIDRERVETWLAPRADLAAGALDAWESLPPNEQQGRLITPIQEALR
jgi:hypothetical protein